jgi:class 3 adenylate cyclase/tetratricopeptide (TPR) repeat protein
MILADDSSQNIEQGRRCHVTLLFSDLCDYTTLSESADPEDVAAVLQATKDLAGRVIEKHGGTLNQFYGDGLLAVFGLPRAGEDDARRAAETALELHAGLRDLSFDFELPARFSTRLHSGIHAGLVFARSSDSRSGRYEIVGDPINTAARLCSAAGPDEILASEAALRGVAPFFELEGIAPLRLKGKFEPLPAFRLLRKTGLSTRFEARAARGLTPFVGREDELGRLLAAFEGVLGGAFRFCQVSGDVGVGKTRLVSELERKIVDRASVYAGNCENYGHAPPLQPFLQILEQAFELSPGCSRDEARATIRGRALGLAPGLERHLPALEQMLGVTGEATEIDPGDIASSHATALTAVISTLSRDRPVCLLLDDWHAADDASYRVLARLLAAPGDVLRRVFVITTSRSIDRGDPLSALGDVLELGPLDSRDAERAIGALLPHAFDMGVAESIRQRSGGNPLFLEELCQAWPYAPGRETEAPGSQPVPSALHGLIQTRIERLPPELLRVGRAAAVIGNEFESWLLERVVPDEAVAEALARLTASGLVLSTDRAGVYRYKHGVTRDVVFDSVRIGERRRLHEAIADAILVRWPDPSGHCEALAHHYAGAGRPNRAAKYAEMAGDKAAQSSSLDRARSHYRAALGEIEKLSGAEGQRARWLEVSRKWAAACVFSPAPEQIAVLERALYYTEEIGAAAGIAHSHYWLGWIHHALGDQERALEHTERALSIAALDAQSRLSTQLMANLGQIRLACAAPNEALSALAQAVQGKRRQHESTRGSSRRSVPVGLVYAMGCQGVAHAYLGDFESAHASLDVALGTVDGMQHAIEASLLGLLAMVQLWQGAYAECIVTTDRMRNIAERIGGPYVFAMSRTFGGYARFRCHADVKALDELRGAVDWIDEREMRLFHSFGLALVAEALFDDQRYEAAERYALRAIERAEQMDRLGEISARRVLARCRVRLGRGTEARELLDGARAIAIARGSRREQSLIDQAFAAMDSNALVVP